MFVNRNSDSKCMRIYHPKQILIDKMKTAYKRKGYNKFSDKLFDKFQFNCLILFSFLFLIENRKEKYYCIDTHTLRICHGWLFELKNSSIANKITIFFNDKQTKLFCVNKNINCTNIKCCSSLFHFLFFFSYFYDAWLLTILNYVKLLYTVYLYQINNMHSVFFVHFYLFVHLLINLKCSYSAHNFKLIMHNVNYE